MADKHTTKGRSRPGSLGALYDVLDEAFPGYRTQLGHLSVRQLAIELGVSTQAVYKWFDKESLARNKVKPLIDLSKKHDGKDLTIEDLAPFVFK